MYIPFSVYNMRKMQIQVLTRDGRKSIYETDRSQNVADLKRYIGRAMNVPMAFSRLAYKGRLLTNDCILEDEGVKRMSTLELFWQPLVLTPKQYREKELELDKLEQKQRHVSRIAQKMAKMDGLERTPSGLRRTRDHLRVKRSLSADDMHLSTFVRNLGQKIDGDEDMVSSTSSDELELLADNWSCSKSAAKNNCRLLDSTGMQSVDVNMNALRAAPNLDAGCKLKGSASSINFQCSDMLARDVEDDDVEDDDVEDDDDDDDVDDSLDDSLEQRCLNCQEQPVCAELRLVAGLMPSSSISNIKEKEPKCKK